MADSTRGGTPGATAHDERRTARLARRIGAFGKQHGAVAASVEYLGRRGARIVLVAEDGAWGDLVAPAHRIAEDAVRRAGVTVHEPSDGDFAAKVRTGPYEWSRMAGIQLGGPRPQAR
jgi:hypothetical protein